MGALGIAAAGLTLLAVAGWSLSELVAAGSPEGPVRELDGAGAWVAAYARAVAAGSWGAARVCLTLAVLVLALRGASLLVKTLGRAFRRPSRSAS
ncbi:hypothetical protein ACPCIX_01425 [Streptomyces pseudogriseolus]|uniref:hypothetical protein n=1 Tax=Streptomyces TaxID=1883 RepID=UPI000A3B14B2|nr:MULTISPECIES: hypothetical protein [Streptomyces]